MSAKNTSAEIINQPLHPRYNLLKILLATNSVVIIGLIMWVMSPSFRTTIKLNFDAINPEIQGKISPKIQLVNQGEIPSSQKLDTSNKLFQSYQYQYQVQSNPSTGNLAPSSHLVTVQLYYQNSNGDLQSQLEINLKETNRKKLVIFPKQNRYGSYGLLHYQQNAYLTSCINVQGKTTVNQQEFLANRNQYDLSLERLPAYLIGRTHWRDHRCIWVIMQTPLTNHHSASDSYDHPEFIALETLWQEIYPHWQKQIPEYKNSL